MRETGVGRGFLVASWRGSARTGPCAGGRRAAGRGAHLPLAVLLCLVGLWTAGTASAVGTGTFVVGASTIIDNTSGSPLVLTNNNAQTWSGGFTYLGSANSLDLGTGPVTLSATQTVSVMGNTLRVSGAIGGGAVGLAKAGAGTLTLGSINSYTGVISVNGGTLLLDMNSGGAFSTSNALTLGGGNLAITASTTSASGQTQGHEAGADAKFIVG